MEGPAPCETEKETAHRLRAMDIGALTNLGIFARTNWRKVIVINLDWLTPYHHANQTMGRKFKPSTDIASTALGKEEMVVRL
jgi:hypothetical protein